MSELYLNALLSIPRVFWWKIKALVKLKMPWIQSFGRNTRLYLNNGKILFGKEIVTRGNNTFRVEGGMLEIGTNVSLMKTSRLHAKAIFESEINAKLETM